MCCSISDVESAVMVDINIAISIRDYFQNDPLFNLKVIREISCNAEFASDKLYTHLHC